MKRSERTDRAVARLRPVTDEQLASLSQSPAAQALFEEVTAMDRATPLPHATETPRPARRGRRLGFAFAAALLAVGAVFALVTLLRQAPPAAAAVEFRSSGRYIVATVVDPYAAQKRLDAAFAARGLDITLKLVPVSPSLVGSVVYMGSSAGASDIGVLYSKTRQAPGGPLPIGLRIPVDFKGQADIVLGRAARPGETYVSTGDAFAPGEMLHGSGLIGMRVSAALARLGELGITAQWRDPANNDADPHAIANDRVSDAVPLAPGKALVFTLGQQPATQQPATQAPAPQPSATQHPTPQASAAQ